MLQSTEGIVLKTGTFGEADLIVTYLTRDYGVIKTFAKSPRKIKSRFGSSLEPLTHAKISFWGKEDAALPRLTQSDIIHTFETLRGRLKCFLKASEMAELTLNFMQERDASEEVFSLIRSTLRALEEDCETNMLFLSCKVKLLEIVGYLPRLEGCGRCGREGGAFYLSHGSVLCESCSRGHQASFSLPAGVGALYKNLLAWEFSKLSRIKPSEILVSELSRVIDEHVKYVLEKNLRTKVFKAS